MGIGISHLFLAGHLIDYFGSLYLSVPFHAFAVVLGEEPAAPSGRLLILSECPAAQFERSVLYWAGRFVGTLS